MVVLREIPDRLGCIPEQSVGRSRACSIFRTLKFTE